AAGICVCHSQPINQRLPAGRQNLTTAWAQEPVSPDLTGRTLSFASLGNARPRETQMPEQDRFTTQPSTGMVPGTACTTWMETALPCRREALRRSLALP